VLETVGIALPESVQGRSLLPLISGESSHASHSAAFAYLDLDQRVAESVVARHMKLIKHRGKEPELFDRLRDPAETRNLFRQRPVMAGYLVSLLEGYRKLHGTEDAPSRRVVFDPELRERLEALGYLR
jgi:hypothetical protein